MSEEQKQQLQQRINTYRSSVNQRAISLFRRMVADFEKLIGQPVIDPNTKQVVGLSELEEVVMEQIGEPKNWAFDLKWVKPAPIRF